MQTVCILIKKLLLTALLLSKPVHSRCLVFADEMGKKVFFVAFCKADVQNCDEFFYKVQRKSFWKG
jgi:hypothetical protein